MGVGSSYRGKLHHYLKPFTSRIQKMVPKEEYIEYIAIIKKLYPRLKQL